MPQLSRPSRRVFPLLLALVCALLLSLPAQAEAADMFSAVSKKIDKYLKLRDNYLNAAQDTWYPQPFTVTKNDAGKKMENFLDDVLLILLDDGLVRWKRDVEKLRRNNEKLQSDISELELRRLSAPEDKRAFEVWKKDVSDIENKIAGLNEKIGSNLMEIDVIKRKMRLALSQAGVEFSDAQMNMLLNSVTGEDTLGTVVALKNVQEILDQLKNIMGRENENINIAKKYYGIFLLTTNTYAYQIQRFMDRIDKVYVPNLDGLRQENNKLMAETKARMGNDPRYRQNYEAQQITEKAIVAYLKFLQGQRTHLRARAAEVEKIRDLAENTYRTVSIAHSLYASMDEGMNIYDQLMSLPILDPVPFENKELELKFMELTRRMGQ